MNRWTFTNLALLASIVAAAPAYAAPTPGNSGFALDRFDPAPRGSDFFELDSLDLRGKVRGALGFTLDFAYKPLVVYDQAGKDRADLVKTQFFGHVGGALVLFDRLRLDLNVPVALVQSGDAATVDGLALPTASGAALGDPRIGADLRLVGTYGDAFTAAIGADVYIPIGNQAKFDSDGKVRLAPHLKIAGQAAGMLEYAAAVGFTYRSFEEQIAGAQVGSQVDFGGAIGLRPVPDFVFGPELYGSTGVTNGSAFDKVATPLEVLLGFHYQIGDFKLGAGAGPGLTRGAGSPQFRGLLSFDWAPRYVAPVVDRDGDGVNDDVDACPDTAGIHTNDPSTNGCPDTDADGIVDAQDACPRTPGVRTQDPKTNGCPPPPADRDHDGIVDSEDACPTVPGVRSSDPKLNGCPRDIDADGIPDTEDACPDIKGIRTNNPQTNGCPGDRDHDGIRDDRDACPDTPGIAELKGCPDKDTDGDGVPDRFDNCPTVKGVKENAGCPPKQKQLVVITREKLEIKQKVFFATNRSKIERKSFNLLNQIAEVIKSHPDIKVIHIEGHTDDRGKAAHNRVLSQERADSVRSYLINKGVDGSRLTAQGFGPDRPIDTNKTAKGRANNRRVDFVIKAQPTSSTVVIPEPESKPAPKPHHAGKRAPKHHKKSK